MSGLTPDQGYADVMHEHGYGYALFQADPLDEYEIVRPGDAGYIMHGKFIPMWNMWEGRPPPLVHKQWIDVRKPIHSRSVKEISWSLGVGRVEIEGAEVGVDASYESKHAAGAILTFRDPKILQVDLSKTKERELKEYVFLNLNDILKQCGLTSARDLVIVTGTVTSGDWNAVYFSDKSYEAQVNTSFGTECLQLLHGSCAIRCEYNQTPYVRRGHDHQPGKNCDELCPQRKNQCVFLRTLRMDRGTRWRIGLKNRIRATVLRPSPQNPNTHVSDNYELPPASESSESSESPGSREGGDSCYPVDSNRRGERSKLEQVSDLLFEYIFEHNDVELVFISDSDILAAISPSFMLNHVNVTVRGLNHGSKMYAELEAPVKFDEFSSEPNALQPSTLSLASEFESSSTLYRPSVFEGSPTKEPEASLYRSHQSEAKSHDSSLQSVFDTDMSPMSAEGSRDAGRAPDSHFNPLYGRNGVSPMPTGGYQELFFEERKSQAHTNRRALDKRSRDRLTKLFANAKEMLYKTDIKFVDTKAGIFEAILDLARDSSRVKSEPTDMAGLGSSYEPYSDSSRVKSEPTDMAGLGSSNEPYSDSSRVKSEPTDMAGVDSLHEPYNESSQVANLARPNCSAFQLEGSMSPVHPLFYRALPPPQSEGII